MFLYWISAWSFVLTILNPFYPMIFSYDILKEDENVKILQRRRKLRRWTSDKIDSSRSKTVGKSRAGHVVNWLLVLRYNMNNFWNQFSSLDWVMMNQFNLKSFYLITHNFANFSFFCKFNNWLSVYLNFPL